MGRRPKYKFLDSVRVKEQPKQLGIVIQSSNEKFIGEIVWIQWPKNRDNVMHVNQLVKEERLKPL